MSKKKIAMNRRQFMVASAVSAGGLLLSPAARAARVPQKTIVMVFLRGGMDGLSLLAPHRNGVGSQSADYEVYANARPTIRMESGVPLSSQFDLNPVCKNLLRLFNAQEANFVVGAGSPNETRSHFLQQDLIEYGNPEGGSVSGGFLNRALATIAASPDVPSASIGAAVNKSLRGTHPALAIPNLRANISAPGLAPGMSLDSRLHLVWSGLSFLTPRWTDLFLKNSGYQLRRSLPVIKEASGFPASQFAPLTGSLDDRNDHYAGLHQFATAARLLKADPSVRYLTIDVGGWDHHVKIGTNEGAFQTLMGRVDRALGAFANDMKRAGLWNNVRVVMMSEFGRRVAENGSAGTDHGRGGVMTILGGNLRGKRILQRNWSLQHLNQGDVPVTVDYRQVFAELMYKWQGVSADNLSKVFPGLNLDFLKFT